MPQNWPPFAKKGGLLSSIRPSNPCYTNVVTPDNPQRCYCRCNFFSVILSLLAKIFCDLVKKELSSKPSTITLGFVCFERTINLDMLNDE
jgi:hypothetical protein